jgi:hypothetical protein
MVARQYTTTPGVAQAPATRLVRAETTVAPRPVVALSVVLFAIIAIVVAAWGAAAPFAGPDFGFVADRFGAWQWSTTSAVLALAPGALALLAGIWVLMAALRPSYGRRPDLWVLGLIVAACGAWFVVGQYVWPVVDARIFIAPSGANHFMWKELCFAVGPGVILVLCGAVFMGWAVRRQLAVVAERTGGAGGAVAPATTPVAPAARTLATAAPTPVTTATGPTGTMAPGAPARAPGVPARTTSERPVAERPGTDRPVAPTDLPPPAPSA